MADWLKDAVIYQIYPSSFYDFNGDGMGDLNGVGEKLDYIKSLGVNCVYLNPFSPSSFYDGGYDVTDFYGVDKRYGSLDDYKRLVEKCHKNGLRIVIDLVLGHTSFNHPWFLKSAEFERNEYSDYYIWTDSIFNKYKDKTVHGLFDRDGGYYANYYASQPALNFGFNKIEEAEIIDSYSGGTSWQMHYTDERLKPLRDEVINIMRFWLDLGTDGFRLDMANSLVKGCNYNTDNIEGLIWLWDKILTPLKKEYPSAAFIPEWIYPENSVGKCGFHLDFFAHDTEEYNTLFRNEKGTNLMRSLEKGDNYFSKNGRGSIAAFLKLCEDLNVKLKGKGYYSVPSGSHDQIRMSKGMTFDELKTVFAFLYTFKHVPMIYYGDEIGLSYRENINKEGGYVRTGSRTPMQWSNGKNRGFSDGDDIFLPVNDIKQENVESQLADENSLLRCVQSLAALRSKYSCFNADGEIEIISNGYPLVYRRYDDKNSFLVEINPKDGVFKITEE